MIAAVDLGASSGRVMAASIGAGRLELTEVHRFPNRPVRLRGTLHWDILGIYREILDGLRACGPDSVGVDSWGVDYGLLDEHGALAGNPVHHRDSRTEGVMERVRARLGDRRLYEVSGLQFLPFNTIYQLAAEDLERAATMLLIPDLVVYWLTGSVGAEMTNASTTGLLNARSRAWDLDLAADAGIPARLLPPLRSPGEPIGPAAELPGTPRVLSVASHDTASAVAAIPAADERFAYISCGTWSLAGVELAAPVLDDRGREANFTNEAGIDGTVRFLRNIMGLWLLQESMRTWETSDLSGLLSAAARAPALRSVIDAGDPEFLEPGAMPARIAGFCARTGQPVPGTPAEVVRCIMDSLALAHRHVIRQAVALTRTEADVVHLVGGGARNALLCRLTAEACGLPVLAGPVEATALGNVLVQARAQGLVADLAEMRALVARTQEVRRFEPSGDLALGEEAWAAAAERITAETRLS